MTRVNIILHGKIVIKLKILRGGGHPGFLEWILNAITLCPFVCGEEFWQTQRGARQCEDGAERDGSQAKEWQPTPRAPQERVVLPMPWFLVQGNWFWTFDLHNYEGLNFCCFKPESLWWCVTANIGNKYILKFWKLYFWKHDPTKGKSGMWVSK